MMINNIKRKHLCRVEGINSLNSNENSIIRRDVRLSAFDTLGFVVFVSVSFPYPWHTIPPALESLKPVQILENKRSKAGGMVCHGTYLHEPLENYFPTIGQPSTPFLNEATYVIVTTIEASPLCLAPEDPWNGYLKHTKCCLCQLSVPESQRSFRAGRDTRDMMFSLMQLQENVLKYNGDLFVSIVDLTKASDTVS
ncbi:Hypothetical predicted protein [Octopus vulgaris]|uniref:Uncharacterized protein n=1 Tax=Octopus vulgaris TaxID=6645 RepID=A0AA36AKU2_OCTVU|nr:Hypothetical predicted protein [Octopus vulgaris]